jgi:hypothetical protein
MWQPSWQNTHISGATIYSSIFRWLAVFCVVLSLNPRLAFGLKIRHPLRHKNVTCLCTKSRVQVHIQGDQKVCVQLIITIQILTSKVAPCQSPDIYCHAELFSTARLTLTPSVIPDSNYVVMVSNWKCLKYYCVFFFVLQLSGAQRFFDHPVLCHWEWQRVYCVTECVKDTAV